MGVVLLTEHPHTCITLGLLLFTGTIFWRIFKIVDLAGINCKDFCNYLFYFYSKMCYEFNINGTIFSENGAIC